MDKNKLDKFKKFSMSNRMYYIILIFLAILIVLLFVSALNMNVTTKKIVIANKYYYHDNLNYYVYLRPNILFNKSVLKNSKIYTNITKKVIVRYHFSASSLNGNPIYGYYKVFARIQTKEWNKTVMLVSPEKYRNVYSVSFPIDFSYFKDLYNKISRELRFKGENPRVFITIETQIKSKNFTDTYLHTLWYPMNSKVFSINTVKSYEKVKNIYKSKIFKDPNKCTLKLALEATSGVLALLLILLILIVKPVETVKDLATQIYEKNRDFIVLGRIDIQDKNIVNVENIKELFKLAEILNKPIIKEGSTFVIIDGNIMYKFELKIKK